MVTDGGSWREIDRCSVLPCAPKTTLSQLPVARQSWYFSRMRGGCMARGYGVLLSMVSAWYPDSSLAGSH